MPSSVNVYMTVCGPDPEVARFVELLKSTTVFRHVEVTVSVAGYLALYGFADRLDAANELSTEFPELCFCGSAGRDGDAFYGIFVVRAGEAAEWNRYERYPATDEMLKGEFPNRRFTKDQP